MLSVDSIHSYYGASHVLRGVTLEVPAAKVVALLGRNGAGKTTTLRSIIGVTPPRAGRIRFDGADIIGAKPHALARRGIAFMPETRGIFRSLTVEENLTLVEGRRRGPWDLARVYALFPRLRERRANGGAQLSGGEQKMLAIARALLLNPTLLLLDEPTEGLAPIFVREILDRLSEVKRQGATILLVEQNFRFATMLADYCHVLGKGVVQWSGTTAELVDNAAMQSTWLGV